MNRRDYLRATAGIATASTIGLAGCAGASAATGTLATHVSDRPGDIGDFERCVVTISEIWVKPADGDLRKEDIEDAEADLVDLQGEASTLASELELPAGEYEYVQLQTDGVDAVLDNGEGATVEVPGDAPLKFATFGIDGDRRETFQVRENETTAFTADFTPVKRGRTGSYVLMPVAEEVTVSYESESTATTNGTATDGTATSS